MLYRLLKAYAVNDPELGYCLGMNFLLGFLLELSNFNEVDTFFLLTTLTTARTTTTGGGWAVF